MSSSRDYFESLTGALSKELQAISNARAKLEEERQQLEQEKIHMQKVVVKEDDIVSLNVGGEVIAVLRSTLCAIEDSMLAKMFSGRWENSMQRDEEDRVFFPCNPYCFRKVVDYLRRFQISGPKEAKPPKIADDMVVEFVDLCDLLGLQELLGLSQPQRVESFEFISPNVARTISGTTLFKETTTGHTPVIARQPFPQTAPSVWVAHLQGPVQWAALGIIGHTSPPEGSYADSASYMWGGNGHTYSGGVLQNGLQDWHGFQQGDRVIFRLDPIWNTLTMAVARRPQEHYTLALGSSGPWYMYVNLYHQTTVVIITEPTQQDLALIQP